MSIVKRVILVSLFGFLQACSFTDRMPELPDQTMSAEQRDQLQERFSEARPALASLKALYIVRQVDPRITYRYAFVFDMPARARVEVLPAQGFFALSLFASDGAEARLLDPAAKVAYRSNEPRALFEDQFGLPLDILNIPYVLSGRLPPAVLTDSNFSWYLLASGEIGLANADMTEYWQVRSQDGTLTRLQIRSSSGRLYADIVPSGTMQFEEHVIPAFIKLDVPLAEQEFELVPQMVKFNEPVREALFAPAIPPSYRILDPD